MTVKELGDLIKDAPQDLEVFFNATPIHSKQYILMMEEIQYRLIVKIYFFYYQDV